MGEAEVDGDEVALVPTGTAGLSSKMSKWCPVEEEVRSEVDEGEKERCATDWA